MRAVMFKNVETSYRKVAEEKQRLKRISEILSEGVYSYLKKKGLLRDDSGRTEKIKTLMEKTEVDTIQDQTKNNDEKT